MPGNWSNEGPRPPAKGFKGWWLPRQNNFWHLSSFSGGNFKKKMRLTLCHCQPWSRQIIFIHNSYSKEKWFWVLVSRRRRRRRRLGWCRLASWRVDGCASTLSQKNKTNQRRKSRQLAIWLCMWLLFLSSPAPVRMGSSRFSIIFSVEGWARAFFMFSFVFFICRFFFFYLLAVLCVLHFSLYIYFYGYILFGDERERNWRVPPPIITCSRVF